MTREEVSELGAAYKRSCRHRRLVYELASKVAGQRLDVPADDLEGLSALSVGVMLLLELGADVPVDLLAETMPHRLVLEW